jgi:hypothetical protein
MDVLAGSGLEEL